MLAQAQERRGFEKTKLLCRFVLFNSEILRPHRASTDRRGGLNKIFFSPVLVGSRSRHNARFGLQDCEEIPRPLRNNCDAMIVSNLSGWLVKPS